MGLSDLDMLVLTTGSHTLGGVHGKITPRITNDTFVPFDTTPGIFDNNIFKLVLENKCVLPIDCKLGQEPGLLPYVRLYSEDQNAFFEQYAKSLEKMNDLVVGANEGVLRDFVDIKIPVHGNLMTEGKWPLGSGSVTNSTTRSGAAATVTTTAKSGAAGANGLNKGGVGFGGLMPLVVSFGLGGLVGMLMM
jgi:hypothetical protein